MPSFQQTVHLLLLLLLLPPLHSLSTPLTPPASPTFLLQTPPSTSTQISSYLTPLLPSTCTLTPHQSGCILTFPSSVPPSFYTEMMFDPLTSRYLKLLQKGTLEELTPECLYDLVYSSFDYEILKKKVRARTKRNL